MAGAQPLGDRPSVGQLLRRARRHVGWSQDVLAARIARVRAEGGESVDVASVKTQISRWENGRVTPDRRTLRVIAEALDGAGAELLVVDVPDELPRPILLDTHVTPATIELLATRRAVHAQTDAAFGPVEAAALAGADLATIDGILRVAHPGLTAPIHRIAALIAELAGWIAQDSGSSGQALHLTTLAHTYAEAANDPTVRAVTLMRLANVVTADNPRLAESLLDQAGAQAGRLGAAIARQRAHAAAVLGDGKAFRRHASEAAENAEAERDAEDLAPYADAAYVASETAAGLVVLGRPEDATALLAGHVASWADGQERDHAVARCRLAHALAAAGDHLGALDALDDALTAYRRAPSVRARTALYAITTLDGGPDRLHRTTLRRRVLNVLEGTAEP